MTGYTGASFGGDRLFAKHAPTLEHRAQEGWWVHQKWIEELYGLRNKAVHEGPGVSSRKWAWAPNEHLAMAAFAFPLTVKALLATEGHYSLTDQDNSHCAAIDKLLVATEWDADDRKTNDGSTWRKVITAQMDADFGRRLVEYLKKQHPDFFTSNSGNGDEASPTTSDHLI